MFGYQKQKIKIETISLTNLETWNFDKCHTNALFSGPGYNLVSHIANNCHIFFFSILQSRTAPQSLSCITLTLLKITGQAFYRISQFELVRYFPTIKFGARKRCYAS